MEVEVEENAEMDWVDNQVEVNENEMVDNPVEAFEKEMDWDESQEEIDPLNKAVIYGEEEENEECVDFIQKRPDEERDFQFSLDYSTEYIY